MLPLGLWVLETWDVPKPMAEKKLLGEGLQRVEGEAVDTGEQEGRQDRAPALHGPARVRAACSVEAELTPDAPSCAARLLPPPRSTSPPSKECPHSSLPPG